jgi:glucose-1-phosphate thymidylyltransferase
MKSLLLASGFGTRLHPLNINKAKGLIEYKGKALISHLVYKIPQDIPILVNTNKKFEADFLQWQDTLSRNITLYTEPVFHEKQALGAIGAIEYCIRTQNIADDLLVIGSDNYFEFDLVQFITSYNGKNTLVAVHDIADKSKACQYGVVQLDGCKIVQLKEKPAQPKCSLIATACYIFPQRIFPLLTQYCAEGKRDNLGGFIAYLIAKDEVHAYTFNEPWFDIGSADIYQAIRQAN